MVFEIRNDIYSIYVHYKEISKHPAENIDWSVVVHVSVCVTVTKNQNKESYLPDGLFSFIDNLVLLSFILLLSSLFYCCDRLVLDCNLCIVTITECIHYGVESAENRQHDEGVVSMTF